MKWWAFIGILLGILLLAIFIYVYPSLREGFASTPASAVTDLGTRQFDLSMNGMYSEYTVFDPSAFYTQLEIAKTDYPVMANTLIQIEKINVNKAENKTSPAQVIPELAQSLYTLLGASRGDDIPTILANDPDRLQGGDNYLGSISRAEMTKAINNGAIAFSKVFAPSTTPASQAAIDAAITAFNKSIVDSQNQLQLAPLRAAAAEAAAALAAATLYRARPGDPAPTAEEKQILEANVKTANEAVTAADAGKYISLNDVTFENRASAITAANNALLLAYTAAKTAGATPSASWSSAENALNEADLQIRVPLATPTKTTEAAQTLTLDDIQREIEKNDPTKKPAPGAPALPATTISLTNYYPTRPSTVQTDINAAIVSAGLAGPPTAAQLATLKNIWTQGVLNPVGSQYLANKPDQQTFNLQAIQNIDSYYTNLLNTFEVHPVRFIAAGYSKGPSNLNCVPVNETTVKCLRHQSTIEETYGIASDAFTNSLGWRINPMFTPAAASIAEEFVKNRTDRNGRATTDSLYSRITVNGTMSPKNLEEIRSSITLTLPFNFTDTSVINSQIRIQPSDPYTLQVCPTYNGMSEWGQGSTIQMVDGKAVVTLITKLMPDAKAFNDVVYTKRLDPPTLKLLPYLCKQYILEWAAGRKAAIMAFDGKTPTAADLTFDTSPPLFNLLNSIPAGNTVNDTVTYPTARSYLIPSEIHAILDKLAQFHYTQVGKTVKMDSIYDVYQIGDTIFDIRYSQTIVESNVEYANKISTLKGEYIAYSQQSLSEGELTQLDLNYTTQMTQALSKTTGNTLGSATNCGRIAQYVKVKRNPTGGRIQLSQIMVVNNSGNNVANGSMVIVGSTQLFNQDDTANHVYSLNPTINAQIVLNTITASIQAKSALLVDGIYTPRAAPFVYTSQTNGTGEYVELKLERPSDISVVQLIPELNSTKDGYSVQLYDSNHLEVGEAVAAVIDVTAAPAPATLVADRNTRDNILTAKFIKPRPLTEAPCPTSILEPYRVGRFYATIESGYPPANLQRPDLSKIKFTGFSEGIHAALSFNPKYNGGFPVSINSSEGNLVYKPVVKYTYTDRQNISAGSLDCTQQSVLLQIMNDYRRSIKSRTFMYRLDVLGIPSPNNYENTNYYYPTSILASVQLSPLSCAIKWTELPVNIETDTRKAEITRIGKFVYATNTTNSNFTDTYYDVSNSVIYPTMEAYNRANNQTPLNPLPTAITIETPYPTSYTLDTANGFCPATDCSDPNVINQLVDGYNSDALKQSPPTPPILVVNKAITVNANQCRFGVITGGSTYDTTSFDIPLTVSYSPTSTMCIYKPILCSSRVSPCAGKVDTASKNIPSSAPPLSNPYSYVVQMAKPYTNMITQNVSTLMSFVSPVKSELNTLLNQYRTDSYAAVGQIQTLQGCDASENILNKCNSASVMDRFMSYYTTTNWNTSRLISVLRAGTYDVSHCDFTVDAVPPTLPGTVALGKTLGFRCTMKAPEPGTPCTFDILSCKPWNPQPPLPYKADVGGSLKDISGTLTDVSGYKPTVASMNASGNVTYPLGTGGTTTVSMLTPGTPYLNTDFTSPINWIDCTSLYALKEMARATGGALSVTSVANKGVNTCIVNGNKSYTFQKISNLLTSLAPIAGDAAGTGTVTRFGTAVNATTLTGTRGTCGFPPGFPSAMEEASGLKTILQGINVDSNTTREYRVNASDFLPFSSTYVRISYYNGSAPAYDSTQCTDIHVNTFSASTEATSPFSYFNNTQKAATGATLLVSGTSTPLVSRPFSAITPTTILPFVTAFKNAWALQHTSATSNPKKHIGPIKSYAYNSTDDSIVFKVEKCVYFGVYGDVDVREVYAPYYISVTYRVLTTTSPATPRFTPDLFNVPTFIFSMTESSSTSVAATSFTPYSDSTWENNKNYPINTDTNNNIAITRREDGLRYNQFRLLRFIVKGTPTPQSPAEVTRIMFYSMYDEKYNSITPSLITFVNPTITVADISANYVKPADPSVRCNTGFTTSPTPDVAGNTICSVPPVQYPKTSGSACGIGFLNVDGTTKCTSTGIFNDVLTDPAFLPANGSAAIPRLRLAYGQSFLITLENTIRVDGFSFITGSGGTVPTSFIVEGSVNGITWKTLVNPGEVPGTSLNYGALGPRSSGTPPTPVLSFFYPGVFEFPSYVKYPPTTSPATRPISTRPVQYSLYQTKEGNIAEGFVSAPLPQERTIQPVPRATPLHTVPEELELYTAYDLPLRANRPAHMYTKQAASPPHPIEFKHRIRYLRFRTMATVDPASKFVSMSKFTLHTRNGTIAPELITFSNLEGSRKHQSEGPQSLGANTTSKRWVDYNKSQLIVQLDTDRLPREPITGFQFHVPNFPGALAALPARWIMEGSNDARSWSTLHEMKSPARFLADYSPVYTFSQEI